MSSISKNTSEDECELRRGPWTLDEDALLVHYIARHGEGRWNLLAKGSRLRRTGKSCRLRWLNYLKPDVKRGNLSPQEQLLILDLHSKWGNRWSKIAQHLPGRTDNEIKNYWRTRVQKQARHLKVDANSQAFQEIIRSFWIPRLLQKIQGSSPSSSMLSHDHQPVNYAPPPLPPPQPHPEEVGHDHNSYSDQASSNSCISSTESVNFLKISELSEYQTCAFHCNIYVDSSCCKMGTMDMVTPSVPQAFENPKHVAESDWFGYDFGDNMWSMEEFMSI